MDEELKSVIKESVEAGNTALKQEIESVQAKLAKLESMPIAQKSSNIIIPQFHKGYNLSKQLVEKRDKGYKYCDEISKMIIDISTDKGYHGDKFALQKAAANQVEGTDASGGYLVLDAFDDMITTTAREASVMMALVNNKSVSTTDTFKFNKQLANVSLAWDAEGAVTNTSATYSQGTINVKRLSGYVSISNELLQDSAYDIVSDIVEQFGYAMGQEMDNQILNGTGTPCSGVLTAAAGYSVVLAAGLTNFSSVTATDYSLAISKLATNDANNATFVLGKLAAHYVRTLKDTSGMPIYQAIAGANLDTIYGTNRVIANKITDTTAVSTAFAVLGDFKQFYLINRLGGLELLVDPYSDSVSYNTRFVWATRKGLGIRRSSAFVRLMTAAS